MTPASTIKILLVEDNPGDARLVREMLADAGAGPFELTHAERLGEASEHLRDREYDVVLLDLLLPDSRGLGTVLQVQSIAPGVAIVVLTGNDDETLALQAVQGGAQDYLVKGQGDGTLIARSLRYAIERKRVEQRLARESMLRATGELASGVAHHLNNLLAVILLRVELLLTSAREPDGRRSLDIVKRTTLDAAEVVRRLLAFTQRQPVSKGMSVDLNQLAQEVLELTRPLWQAQAQIHGAEIHAWLEPGQVPPAYGDPVSLREVLLNLLLNAVDALPRGGTIVVRTWTSDQQVHCAVMDNGVGMSEEVRRRAVEPFFTTQGPQRTGLGLSVTDGILQRFRGKLVIESAEGRGTSAGFSLPAAGPARPSGAQRPPSPLRILVIDDDVDVLSVLVELLSRLGHSVLSATQGREGLARLEAGEPPDLVLLDLGMPEMIGWDVARAVKALRPDLPVGLVTGWGEEPQGSDEQRAHVDFIIAKPVTLAVLRDAIAGLTA
jgi:signal transduction histidine kinase